VAAPVHKPGCVLDPVHWLRHAVAAAGWLVGTEPAEDGVDQISAQLLTDSLAHFGELDDWATVTLHDLALHATAGLPEPDRFGGWCSCGATGTEPDA